MSSPALIPTQQMLDLLRRLEHRAAMREVDARSFDGITVRLLWHPVTRALIVTAYDVRSGEQLELPVDACDARAVYDHPFANSA